MATLSYLALIQNPSLDIRLSPRNTKKRPEVIVIVKTSKPDGGREGEPKQTAPGGQPTITSSFCIMAGEAPTTNGRK